MGKKFKRCKFLGKGPEREGFCFATKDPFREPVRCVNMPHEECEYEPES